MARKRASRRPAAPAGTRRTAHEPQPAFFDPSAHPAADVRRRFTGGDAAALAPGPAHAEYGRRAAAVAGGCLHGPGGSHRRHPGLSRRQLAGAVRHRAPARPAWRADAAADRRAGRGCRGGRGQGRRADGAAFPRPVTVPADGPQWRLPGGRPLQPLCLLRDPADRLLCLAGAWRRARADRRRAALRLAEPGGLGLFLIAIGVLYGLSGTLNMAHMGLRLAGLPPADVPLATAAGAMLMLVFGLKAALFPMLFWLPKAYASATGSAAALFAIMTKVGIYAILRCAALIFGAPDGMLAAFLHDWVWWMALATMGFGALGALAAPNLKTLTCYLVLASVGLLAASVSMQTGQSWAGALYYLLSTTLCTAALFLLADALEPAPPAGSAGQPVPVVHGSRLAGALFLVAALAAIGLPPLSGFIGKVMVMRSAPLPAAAVLWPGVLLSSLALLIAVSRTGTRLLWRLPQEHDPERHGAYHRVAPDGWKLGCCAFLLACSVALVLFAQPLSRYLADTAAQLFDRAAYLRAVLPAAGS
ncbi:proton-conducting transporter transmembrane domain-containing protein [Cupriavidus basilensis]